MSVDVARQHAAAVEARTLGAAPALPDSPGELLSQIRNHLITATDVEMLAVPPHRIFQLLNLDVKRGRNGASVASITCGCPFDKGQEGDDFIWRPDRGRMSFGVTIAYEAAGPRLVAYRFHLQFPPGTTPAFVRFDLNEDREHDALLEPRSHVHAGCEDIRVSVPVMAPVEILTKLVYGIPVPGGD